MRCPVVVFCYTLILVTSDARFWEVKFYYRFIAFPLFGQFPGAFLAQSRTVAPAFAAEYDPSVIFFHFEKTAAYDFVADQFAELVKTDRLVASRMAYLHLSDAAAVTAHFVGFDGV